MSSRQINKWRTRFMDSGLSAGRSLMVPALNFVLAYLVIQWNSRELWGEFVSVLIFTAIASMVVGWGIKGHALRQASLHPKHIVGEIKSGLLTRSILLIPISVFAFYFFPPEEVIWVIAWIFAMLIHAGIDPLINFTRSYGRAIFAELIYSAFLIAYISLVSLCQHQLIVGFSLATMLRTLVLIQLFKKHWSQGVATFSWSLLAAGAPFLLMGFSGMLQSKTDLYLVRALLGDADTAVYQVTINFFIYLQALAALLLMPLAKNLFRVDKKTIWKLSLKYGVLGAVLLAVSIPVIRLILNSVYFFDLELEVFIYGSLYVLPSFVYGPMLYSILGKKQEKKVLVINLIGILANLIFSTFFLQYIGLIGAILGGAIAQWSMLFIYIIILKNTKNETA